MRRLTMLLAALLVSVPGLASEAERPEAFAAVAPLQLQPGQALQRLSLPWPVLQASRSAGLADVRVFDAEGRAVPQAWARPAAAGEQQRSVILPAFAWPEPAIGQTGAAPIHLQLGSNGALLSLQMPAGVAPMRLPAGQARQWLLDLGALKALQEERAVSLRLDWPVTADGLSSAVLIERSDDGQQWSPAGQGRVLELAAASAPRIDRLAWTTTTTALPRYLRLRFDSPVALKGAQLDLSRRQAAAAPLQQPVRFEPLAGEAAQWQLDLQGRLAPEALALELPEGNHLMNLRLEQRQADGEAWRPVARFVAWRFGENRSPAQLLSAPPARFWRLVAEGSTPSPLKGQVLPAQWHWRPPQLVLLAQGSGGGVFRLAVGRAGLERAATTPLAGLMPGYQDGDEYKLPEAVLGALQPQAEPGLQERLSAPDAATQRRWLLWAVLIAAVAGLAWMARGLLAQIKPPGG